ncbi:2-oxo-4-hydroxy-4-carboxy-5-ureidoimidazoline decarboxylase [Actinomycetospora sp. OC33-EN08]|uniref:2-oxo-4-hydroxy-4-carboxy-5-ureidoimidazoline decarboxylase n=1 Tax=Actinomycetospora aurantiaca TaxID=3129233 RepID=A0ABU8MI29_9PSEU
MITVDELAACNASPAWLEAVRSVPAQDLPAAGERAVLDLPWSEVLLALEAHPRIGDRVVGASAESEASRREQSGVGGASDDTRAALVEANAAYEQRFGHVFLIRAAGRSGEEMLAEARRRLDADPMAEQDEVREQLAAITRLRLERLVSP